MLPDCNRGWAALLTCGAARCPITVCLCGGEARPCLHVARRASQAIILRQDSITHFIDASEDQAVQSNLSLGQYGGRVPAIATQ